MTNLNRNSIEQIIAGLSKQAAYIDATKHIDDTLCKTNTPILIGDVLERMDEDIHENHPFMELLYKWSDCGFTRSLQEIVSEIEYENRIDEETMKRVEQVAKPSPQADLFKFLLSLNLVK